MIVYGIGSKLLKEATVENVTCPSCEHPSSVMSAHQRYFDLFWIPIFPLGKKIVLVCPNCDHVTEEKNFTDEFKQSSKKLKSSLSTPKYMFTGLAIILLLISYVGYGVYQDDELNSDYINNPIIGDVYNMYDETQETEFKYYYYKISAIEGDSIYVYVNDYYYNGTANELDPADGFYDEFEIGFHKDEMLNMFTSGEIKVAYRNYKASFNQTLVYDPDMSIEQDSLNLTN